MSGPAFGLDFDARARAALDAAPAVFLRELAVGVLEGQLLLEREVRERTPTSGAGTLRDSIGALPIELSGERVVGAVGTSLAYAEPVEVGSRPHVPPLEPLADWVRRKLGKTGEEGDAVANAIRWAIAKRGTKGAFMFRDALAAVQPQLESILAAAAQRAIHRVGGAAS
ncbi:hypothetical protein HL658_31360 [Azospirillum sp. RWY-5-1]|uniref:HK97 gp10 family phage protein n=1 Tax=Azospirillum oleiclasticum TaxID=2735135 RepID=A0ABX2TKD0_9PROT|nr:HK97 gp10 family phage protein [Azospirillum oleiclasticum]NYZ17064.1 hypothetical protein [Azospirillum oleiclasticum]NYZ24492.1 hypothetical protein [Azospirillum oleiclasticum]